MIAATTLGLAGATGAITSGSQTRIPVHVPASQRAARGIEAPITRQRADAPGSEQDSDQKAASRAHGELHAFTVGSVREARLDICGSKIRKVVHNLPRRHPGSKVLQHVVYSDSKPTNAGFAAALSRFDGNALAIVHLPSINVARSRIIPTTAIGPTRQQVFAGLPMSYGNGLTSLLRTAEADAARILLGAKPADLPIGEVAGIDFDMRRATPVLQGANEVTL